MIEINPYDSNQLHMWNDFNEHSKNGLFLFNRDYMEYHSDRFEDNSLMIYENKKLVAIMPAHSQNGNFISHNGLTFGGLIYNHKMRISTMLKIFPALINYCRDNGFKKIYYKAIPHIYHTYPAEEDLYALKINNFKLIRRDVSSAISLNEKISLSRNRRRQLKDLPDGLKVSQSDLFKDFMLLVKKNTQKRYNTNPVHSGKEMELLASNFPDNIKLFVAEMNDEILAGVIMYESQNVAHGQYHSFTDEGLEIRASDFLLNFLINNYYINKKYFDFGISTEDNGNFLNNGLINFKEGFGGRAVVHDFYELNIE